MTLLKVQEKVGIGAQRHASVRRAIKQILDESTHKVPTEDLIRIITIAAAALAV